MGLERKIFGNDSENLITKSDNHKIIIRDINHYSATVAKTFARFVNHGLLEQPYPRLEYAGARRDVACRVSCVCRKIMKKYLTYALIWHTCTIYL